MEQKVVLLDCKIGFRDELAQRGQDALSHRSFHTQLNSYELENLTKYDNQVQNYNIKI